MRGLIYYYSGTGNTHLACQAIASNVHSANLELCDITQSMIPNPEEVDLIGLATWTDFLDPPQRMKSFIESLPMQAGSPAFVFNTFGGFSGKTLSTLHRWAKNRGFRVIAGHSLHMPENYPPMIKRGKDFKDSPNSEEFAAFTTFIAQLEERIRQLADGKMVSEIPLTWARFMPSLSRSHARRSMGMKFVDADACTSCGVCREHCPYGAIALAPQPVFDQTKCYGCWACYNHCPTQAIYTRKVRDVSQYARPNDELRRKISG